MNQKKMTARYCGVTILNIIITVVEFIGGVLSGSLALLSDAVHNLGDVGAIVLGFIAQLIGQKQRDKNKTFGYKRAETLAAYTNGIVLVVISIVLMVEAIQRFYKSEMIHGQLMLWIAIIGLIANGISMLVMGHDANESLNVKATFLHMMSDALSSVVVIIGAIIISIWHIYWLDPILTIIVSLFILKEAFGIVKKATNILMEANPNIDLGKINKIILSFPQVENVHHVHVWKYSDNTIMLDAHINVAGDTTIGNFEKLYQKIALKLKQQLGISHVTLQVECKRGLEEKLIAPTKTD